MKRYVDYLGRPASIPGEFAGRITADGFRTGASRIGVRSRKRRGRSSIRRRIISMPASSAERRRCSATSTMPAATPRRRRKLRAAFNRRFLDPATGIYGPPGAVAETATRSRRPGGKVPHEIWWHGRPALHPGRAGVAAGSGDGARGTPAGGAKSVVARNRRPPQPAFDRIRFHAVPAPSPGRRGARGRLGHDLRPGLSVLVRHDRRQRPGPAEGNLGGRPGAHALARGQHRGLALPKRWAASAPTRRGPASRKSSSSPASSATCIGWKATTTPCMGGSSAIGASADGQLVMDVTIPANTTATVFVPAKDAAGVTDPVSPRTRRKG